MSSLNSPGGERRSQGSRYTYDTIKNFLEFSTDFSCVCTDGIIKFINNAGLRILEAPDDGKIIGKGFAEFLGSEFSNIAVDSSDLLLLIIEEKEALRARLIGLDGREISVEISVQWAREFGTNSVIVMAHDISKQINLTQELHRGEERFRRLVDNAMDMICSCKNGIVSFINQSGIKLMRANSREQLLGTLVSDLFHDDYREIFEELIEDLIQDDEQFPAKLALCDGSFIDVHIAVSQVDKFDQENYMLEVRDISEHRRAVMALHDINLDLEQRVKDRTHELSQEIKIRKKAEKKLRQMATHDNLTGLPNRSLLIDRIENAIAGAKRNKGQAALMFIDLDGFKAVNDTLGHEAGDILLKDVAKCLASTVRQTDTVARIGGDEFIILLSSIPDEEMALAVAKVVLDALANPFKIMGDIANIGGSIGISYYPKHGEYADQLLKSADNAMYEVKKRGKNSIAIAP
jgi:diguanylate cyclase (GGDEF)-like protein/PAS domain S-box-containing protein